MAIVNIASVSGVWHCRYENEKQQEIYKIVACWGLTDSGAVVPMIETSPMRVEQAPERIDDFSYKQAIQTNDIEKE